MRHLVLLLPAFAILICAPSVRAQDFSVLSRLHEADRDLSAPLLRAPGTPKLLIAGDSWARFLWDDGAHTLLLDRFGLSDHSAISLSLGSDPGPGYTGPEYAVSGSEARQWADTAAYPWLANAIAALQAHPGIDWVVLSLGGNDVLAGRSGGGWYKDMDLDVPGSEAAFFDQLEADSFFVIDALLAVRPELRVMISSYDYPNFNVGLWCFLYACPKREDLSRDPNNDLITDSELNAMMVEVESRRRGWAAVEERVFLDNSIGLMHHVYGDGVSGPRVLERPGREAPDHLPFPGGNPLLPSLRSNFRRASGLDADPIHLTGDGYRHKAGQQIWAHLLRDLVPEPELRLQSAGADADGWTDGVGTSTGQLAVGDDGTRRIASILQFDTSEIPSGSAVSGATLWLTRTAAVGTNPFTSGALGAPRLDIASGGFGSAAMLEPEDLEAPADLSDAGSFEGSVGANGATLRVDIATAALDLIAASNLVEFRIAFDDADALADRVEFAGADVGAWTPSGFATFAETLGSAAPVLELQLEVNTAAGFPSSPALVLRAPRPNPFNPATEVAFELERSGQVRVTVHDVRGRLVRVLAATSFEPGTHRLRWDGSDARGTELASGVYIVRAVSGGVVAVQRAVLVR